MNRTLFNGLSMQKKYLRNNYKFEVSLIYVDINGTKYRIHLCGKTFVLLYLPSNGNMFTQITLILQLKMW